MRRLSSFLIFGSLLLSLLAHWAGANDEEAEKKCAPPRRARHVSKSATWAGECQHGVWIEVLNLFPSRARLRVLDSHGKTLRLGWFRFEHGCDIRLEADFRQALAGYEDGHILLNKTSTDPKVTNCNMNPIRKGRSRKH